MTDRCPFYISRVHEDFVIHGPLNRKDLTVDKSKYLPILKATNISVSCLPIFSLLSQRVTLTQELLIIF
jgi:hypothetical protein